VYCRTSGPPVLVEEDGLSRVASSSVSSCEFSGGEGTYVVHDCCRRITRFFYWPGSEDLAITFLLVVASFLVPHAQGRGRGARAEGIHPRLGR